MPSENWMALAACWNGRPPLADIRTNQQACWPWILNWFAIQIGNDFVAYVDAVGELDGTRCLLEWKTTASRYPDEPAGLLALDPQLVCYSDRKRLRSLRGCRRRTGWHSLPAGMEDHR